MPTVQGFKKPTAWDSNHPKFDGETASSLKLFLRNTEQVTPRLLALPAHSIPSSLSELTYLFTPHTICPRRNAHNDTLALSPSSTRSELSGMDVTS
ncbi:hypothetical protein B0H14DRAFT_3529067 [Mycena olivaceomarginata]|nr:hypothetical protein B0H14DRAFT_3529067 [Mycena olivaceomarginata]